MAEEQEQQEQKSGGNKTILFVVLGVVLLLIIIGVVAIMLMSGGHKEEDTAESSKSEYKKSGTTPKVASAGATSLMSIGPTFIVFSDSKPTIVNLSTQGREAYLSVAISIALSSEKLQPEVEKKVDAIKFTIIDVFSSKTPDELKTSKGKEKVLEEIRQRLNSFLVDGEVTNVFPTNFIIQQG